VRPLVAILALLAGCASERDLYHWGVYEDSVREALQDPGGRKAPERIRILSADIDRAKAEGRKVAPGVHAHLGYLHSLAGDRESAVRELESEKELYPESAAFVDGRIGRPIDVAGAPRANEPRSILVLPNAEGALDPDAKCGWLPTITRPLAERGYYVFPVAVVDAMLRENGSAAPDELRERFGADAVLYVDVVDWGPSLHDLQIELTVTLEARLVDLPSGTELWRGTSSVIRGSNEGSLFDAIVSDVTPATVDPMPGLARQASWALVHSREGLLPGPRRMQEKPSAP
jgi:hypothetical protein